MPTPSRRALALALLPACVVACSRERDAAPPRAGDTTAPVAYGARSDDGDASLPSEDGQWTMAAKNFENTRFSGLTQIDTTNVSRLVLAWTFETGVLRGQEAAPLIVNGTMYIVTPFPNRLYALDLTKPGHPQKWMYEPKPLSAAQGVACCDVVNRGAAFHDGKIYFNTLDGNAIAVDAATGTEVWRTLVGDINKGETITMAPIVVRGKVLVGDSGGELGVRGKLTALDAGSGKIVWQAFSTGPDRDVLIGPRFKPFYPSERGTDLGVETWPPDAWKVGGGAVWGWISYDSTLNLVYYGTSNPGPWNQEQRPGDNKWTSTLFARDPDTGEAVWAYQTAPHDLFDWDDVNESIVADLTIGGRARKALVRPDRNGYVYVIDRTNGEVLSATSYGPNTTTTGVDLRTGRLQHVREKTPSVGKTVRDICPASPGAKDWQPSAWSPRTRLLYIPHQNICMDVEAVEASYIAGTPYVGMNVKMFAGPGGKRGEFAAWDPVAGKKVWSIAEDFPVWTGTVVTAGDIAFYGTMDGWFRAVNARSGRILWQYKLGSGTVGQPVTYRGPDGKQYVAILSGVGGWPGAIVAGGLDARDSTIALGFGNAMRDLPSVTAKGGTLYVFALP